MLKLTPSPLKGKSDAPCVRASEPGLCQSATRSPLLKSRLGPPLHSLGRQQPLVGYAFLDFVSRRALVGIALWPWATFLSPSSPQLEGSEQGPQALRNSVNPAIVRSDTGVYFAQISSSFPGQPEIVPGTRPKGDQGKDSCCVYLWLPFLLPAAYLSHHISPAGPTVLSSLRSLHHLD